MHQPFKGMILAEPKGSLKNPPTAKISQAAAKAAVFLCLGVLATRKRVYVLFETQLITHNIFLQLVPYVLLYRFFISTDRIYVVPPAPKMSIAILIL